MTVGVYRRAGCNAVLGQDLGLKGEYVGGGGGFSGRSEWTRDTCVGARESSFRGRQGEKLAELAVASMQWTPFLLVYNTLRKGNESPGQECAV